MVVIRLAEKMIDRIAEACEFDGTTLSIRASIGVAMYPADGETADILFKNADAAMYKAKGNKDEGCPIPRLISARKRVEADQT